MGVVVGGGGGGGGGGEGRTTLHHLVFFGYIQILIFLSSISTCSCSVANKCTALTIIQ